jgi:AP-2 complex subunit alpha
VKVGGYILGEFGILIANVPGANPMEQFNTLQSKFGACSLQTRALLLTTYLKFINIFPEIKGEILSVFNHYRHVLDSELQQRAAEYMTIATMPTDDLLQTVCEEMPPFPERESALLSRLHQKHSDTEDKRTWVIGGKDINKDARFSTFGSRSNSTDSKSKNEIVNNGNNGNGEFDLLHELEGLDLNGQTENATTTKPLPAGSITPGSERWFGKLLYNTEGVLFDDSQLQVGMKSEYHGHLGRLALYFRNKTQTTITSFTTVLEHIENLVITTPQQPATLISPSGQIQQLFHLECQNLFKGTPNVRISFISGTLHTIVLKLPIVLTKFMEPIELNGQEFFTRWKQIGGGPREKQTILQSNIPINLQGLRIMISGFRYGILEGVDPNPDNVVGASVLHTAQGGMTGCLMRLEPNVKAQVRLIF